MKKLYFLDEAEKNRILNLHESATKRQYIKEDDTMSSELDEIDAGMVTTASIFGGPLGTILALVNAGQSGDKAYAIFQKCKSSKGKLGKRKMDDSYLAKIADNLNAAVEGAGTNEELIKSSFKAVTSIADLCALANIYSNRHSEDLYSALDGDIDSDSEWKTYVFLPLLDNAVKNSKAEMQLMQQQAVAKQEEYKKLAPKAAACGWNIKKADGSTVPDVEGYKKSNWQCPKAGSSKTNLNTKTKDQLTTTTKVKPATAPSTTDFDKFLNT